MSTNLHVLKAWLHDRGLTVEVRPHHIAKGVELDPALAKTVINLCGPDHLIVVGNLGKISVIRGEASFGHFEIYCLEGDLFGGIRRYRTVESAGKTIYSLLTTGLFDESVPRVFDVWNDFFASPDGSVQEVEPDDFEPEIELNEEEK